MADTEPVCRFPGCDDPVHADGICRDHHEQFHGKTDAAPAQQSADATPAAAVPVPAGRLRISPLHAVVRTHGPTTAVYGVYGTPELAANAAAMLTELGIPGGMDVVPFYEVTP